MVALLCLNVCTLYHFQKKWGRTQEKIKSFVAGIYCVVQGNRIARDVLLCHCFNHGQGGFTIFLSATAFRWAWLAGKKKGEGEKERRHTSATYISCTQYFVSSCPVTADICPFLSRRYKYTYMCALTALVYIYIFVYIYTHFASFFRITDVFTTSCSPFALSLFSCTHIRTSSSSLARIQNAKLSNTFQMLSWAQLIASCLTLLSLP